MNTLKDQINDVLIDYFDEENTEWDKGVLLEAIMETIRDYFNGLI